jgi:hypothetical protein
MPQFCFHITNPKEGFRDTIGIELPNLSAAHERALKLINTVARYMKLKNGPETPRRAHWIVYIADANGRNILTVLSPSARGDVRRSRLWGARTKPHQA